MSASAVKLHSTVLLSIADALVRSKQQYGKLKIFGLIFGTSTGDEVRCLETFDQGPLEEGSVPDGSLLQKDIKTYLDIYSQYKPLGWYSTGSAASEQDNQIHKMVSELFPNPCFVLLRPAVPGRDAEIPVSAFRSTDSNPRLFEVPWNLASDESERITMDFASMLQNEKSGSAVTQSFPPLTRAAHSFSQRLEVLQRVLLDHQSGKAKCPQKLLRGIKALVQRIPIMDSGRFRHDFQSDYNDALLVTLLSSLTKSAVQVSEVMEKFNSAYSESSSGERGMKGLGGFSEDMMMGNYGSGRHHRSMRSGRHG